MTSSSGHAIENDCEMKDALTLYSQETHQIQEHNDASQKKRKALDRLCASCNKILTGQKTLCQCCAGCCDSAECRSMEHIMVKQLKERESHADALRRTGMSAESAWKLVGADSPRHQQKRVKQGDNEILEKVEENVTPEKTRTKKMSKSDTKRIEKTPPKDVEKKTDQSKEKKSDDEDKHNEETEKDNMQLITRLKERVDELEKLCRRFQAEIEVLQQSRHERPITREPVRIVAQETKQHEKRLQEIEKQVKNLNISNHKESAADTAFRLKHKRIIEKEFELQEWGEQNVEIRARERQNSEAPLLLARKIQGVVYGDGGPYIECNVEDVCAENLPNIQNRSYFNLLSTADGTVHAYSQKRDVKCRPNPPLEARYRDARNRKEGYANYKVGKVYFNPDEIFVWKDEKFLPREKISLSEMLDKDENILSREEKIKQRSLIFYNCAHNDEVGLKGQLIEKQVMTEQTSFVSFERIGKQQEDRLQPVRVTFTNPRHVEDIFSRRKNLKGTTLFVARDLSRDELRERAKEHQTAHNLEMPRTRPSTPHSFRLHPPSNRVPLPPTRPTVASSPPYFQRSHPTPFPNHPPIRPASNPNSNATRSNHIRPATISSSGSSSSTTGSSSIAGTSRQQPHTTPISTSNTFHPLTQS